MTRPLQTLHDKVEAGELVMKDYGRLPIELYAMPCTSNNGNGSDHMKICGLAYKSYHGSLDAAKALMDAAEGWVIQSIVQRHGGVWVAHIWEVNSEGWHQEEMRRIEVWNEYPARALLLGRLRALINEGE